MQTEIFPASGSARRGISRTAYLFFGGGVGLLTCAAITIGVSFASGSPPNFIVIAASGVACAGIAGLVGGIVTLPRLRQAIQVEVDPYRLVWREGRRTATVEYDDVVRVELVKDHDQRRGGITVTYPVVRFIENDGEMMEFEVTFEDRGMIHQGRFDARAITAAVLPHLPAHAVVAPTVKDFVRTGEVDTDLLPER
jgi:hypothetical protein